MKHTATHATEETQGRLSRLDFLKRTVAVAGTAVAAADFTWKFYDRNSADMVELEKQRGVQFVVTPQSVLKAQLEAWDRIVEAESKANPIFAKVIGSQRAWAERTVPSKNHGGEQYGVRTLLQSLT
jgi:TRAP-type mannitol/chloroaromatic compound transport system substrate-binding protein